MFKLLNKRGKATEYFLDKNSEYDREMPQSQTEDKPVAPRGRATHQSRGLRKTNKAKINSSLFPIKTRMDTK